MTFSLQNYHGQKKGERNHDNDIIVCIKSENDAKSLIHPFSLLCVLPYAKKKKFRASL